MTPLVLRPYQIDAIDRLRNSYASGRRAPLFQLPTGGGNMQQIGRGMRAVPGKVG